jgi:hypothetical protein
LRQTFLLVRGHSIRQRVFSRMLYFFLNWNFHFLADIFYHIIFFNYTYLYGFWVF